MTGAGARGIRDPEHVLRGLKDFQRDTVDYVFRRLFLDAPRHTRRFLVADEVGLGKTMVARGVIARTLAHLAAVDHVDRLDVVYVCSNGAIAQQNINRLNVTGIQNVALPTRLSLLPLHVRDLAANAINFVSLTPGTSFNSASRGGAAAERILLWAILRPDFPEFLADGLANFLQCSVSDEKWLVYLKQFERDIDWDLQRRFLRALYDDDDLWRRVKEVCDRFRVHRRIADIHWQERSFRNQVVSDLRSLMARVCVHALEPDLIILDEFQRFRDLLTGDDDAAELTKAFLNYREPSGHHARTLLLSATPYRMMSLAGDEEDHYADFLETCRFLFDEDQHEVDRLEEDLRRLRRGLSTVDGGAGDALIEQARASVEDRLKKVMVRTERVPASRRRDSMLATSERRAELLPGDLEHVRVADRVSRHLGSQDVIEYWKSAPYLLNLMTDYHLKKRLREMIETGDPEVGALVRSPGGSLLDQDTFERYEKVDPGNARLRLLLDDTVEAGLWRLLWMPPAQPYLGPGGAYAEVDGGVTKALVFSTWNVVPDAIAALVSYEAERRIVTQAERDVAYGELSRKISSPLRFVIQEGRFTGAYSLLPFYPSPTLAAIGDPLSLAEAGEAFPVDTGQARARVEERIRARLEALEAVMPTEWEGAFADGGADDEGELAVAGDRGAVDEERELAAAEDRLPADEDGAAARGAEPEAVDQSWYWRRVAHLDRPFVSAATWVRQKRGWEAATGRSDADGDGGFAKHIKHFGEAFGDEAELPEGPPPEDLVDVLTDLALGSPAVCALRALHRLAPELALDDHRLLSAAARVAQGFRTLFDMPETYLLLQSDVRYWQRIARYGIEGNLQATLDEYTHVLVESLGLAGHEPGEMLEGVAQGIEDVLSIRTSRVAADKIRAEAGSKAVSLERFHIRTRFALRFGDLKGEDEKRVERADVVRSAFNSPFRPFVLASTSVGQEGLDFHLYCHALYHWNLPSNPVDLEQREGRVHRYKSHAVRKNIAHSFGRALAESHRGRGDPWRWMFDQALEARPPGVDDLVPYWIYEDGPTRVERRIPLIPLTREVGKLRRLIRSLAVYRMVFGQPRQEDLLALLASELEGEEGVAELAWEISLRPPRGVDRPAVEAVTNGVAAGEALMALLPAFDGVAAPSKSEIRRRMWERLVEYLREEDLPVPLPKVTGTNRLRLELPDGGSLTLGFSLGRPSLKVYWRVGERAPPREVAGVRFVWRERGNGQRVGEADLPFDHREEVAIAAAARTVSSLLMPEQNRRSRP